MALVLWASPASAQSNRDVDDFFAARDAFTNGEYASSSVILRTLIDVRLAANPQLAPLATSMRLMYAAALFADRHADEARAAITALLREDPNFGRPTPAQYEAGFMRLYDQVKAEIEPELASLRAQRERARIEAARRSAERRALTMQLLSVESRITRTPLWPVFVPFGTGQFINGDVGLGVAFLTVELAALATAAVTTGLYFDLYASADRNYLQSEPRARLDDLFAANIVAWSVFGAVGIAGIIQAAVAYRRERVNVVPRPLPRALEGMQISFGPGAPGQGLGGATLRLTF